MADSLDRWIGRRIDLWLRCVLIEIKDTFLIDEYLVVLSSSQFKDNLFYCTFNTFLK